VRLSARRASPGVKRSTFRYAAARVAWAFSARTLRRHRPGTTAAAAAAAAAAAPSSPPPARATPVQSILLSSRIFRFHRPTDPLRAATVGRDPPSAASAVSTVFHTGLVFRHARYSCALSVATP